MKKTLHIIPHSHWDREWYMSFERHRVRLVELFDTLIKVMEENPEYTYYHLDGQFVVIEDYLEIKPHMRDRLFALIRADRIQIGPWYVLQDEYLTSGEANVRNMLYGIKLCREIGAEPVMCGYFPDAFGNIGQAPQILRGFGIDNAVFGRGLNDLGSDNAVVKQNGITGSELIWQAPDGSEVFGIMFANWYHNAMELPSDPDSLRERIKHIVASTSRFAATDHLLGMNGCDHQPVQTNLHEVIKLANEVQDEVTVKQSNFKDYIAEIRKHKDKFKTVRGEIAGQYTAGHYLLINTASSHIDIKQKNHETQLMLERIAEPLNSLSYIAGDEYRDDFFLYAWRTLMQNHPHDSICSCSCDEVYDEMLIRFQKAFDTADEMKLAATDYLTSKIDTSAGTERNLVVFSLEPTPVTTTVKTVVDFPENSGITEIHIKDAGGNIVPASYRFLGRTFTYTLPKDSFRKPKFVDRFEVEFVANLSGGLGYEVYTVHPGAAPVDTGLKVHSIGAENEFYKLTFNKNGTFELEDKQTGRIYSGCNLIEDTRDEGDLYNYRPVKDDVPVTSVDNPAEISIDSQNDYSVTFKVKAGIDIDADVTSYIKVTAGIPYPEIKTVVDNRFGNHRLRALFPADIMTDKVLAEGQFDLVERNITPWEGWQNPSNTQRCMAFFAVEGERDCLAIANRGLCEYEVLRDGRNTMAVTLLRCVDEMGDWGIFPTPKGQCIGRYELEYAPVMYTANNKARGYSLAYAFAGQPALAVQTGRHSGPLPASHKYLAYDNEYVRMSALKKAEYSDSLIFRCFNISNQAQTTEFTVDGQVKVVYMSRLDETRGEEIPVQDGKFTLDIGAKKIVTLELVLN
jgi:alpha-mannosidase/mannosylglycerate hydrolase